MLEVYHLGNEEELILILGSPTRSTAPVAISLYHMRLAKMIIVNGHPFGMPLNQTTITSELKNGGYATHCIWKVASWHV